MKINVFTSGTIVGNFFLHEPVQRAELVAKWLRRDMLPWTQPFDDIREYFGEKYALYFLFYGHYSQWLLLPALIGFPCQIAVWVMGDYSAPFLPYYAYFIALWGVVMLEYWKRKEKTKAMEWGTIDFEDNELDRAEFKGRGLNRTLMEKSSVTSLERSGIASPWCRTL